MKSYNEFNAEQGVYISVKPMVGLSEDLNEYLVQNFLDHVPFDKIHSTIVYSAKPFNDVIEPSKLQHVAKFKEWKLFGPNKDVLVMALECDSMVARNAMLFEKFDLVSDYGEYVPHITINYETNELDLSTLPVPDFDIILGNEVVEPLDLDWVDKTHNK